MPTLAEFIAQLAAQGAPLGDTDDGFLAWLTPRHQPPTA